VGEVRELSEHQNGGQPVFAHAPVVTQDFEGGFGCEVSCNVSIEEGDHVVVEIFPNGPFMQEAEDDLEGYKEVIGQITYATAFSLNTLRQKLCCKSRHYDSHTIFGTGLSSSITSLASCTKECVICMCEPRDTIVVPCRHMCLCARCASTMLEQNHRCPLCRHKVLSYVQIPRQAAVSALSGDNNSDARVSSISACIEEDLRDVELGSS